MKNCINADQAKKKRTHSEKEIYLKRLKYEESKEEDLFFRSKSLDMNETGFYTNFSDVPASTSMTCDLKQEYNFKKLRYEKKKSRQRQNQVHRGKFYRSWKKVYNNTDKIDKMIFRVASYNLLAPLLAAEHYMLYRSGNPTYMDWNYRKKKIREEIINTHSDVILKSY